MDERAVVSPEPRRPESVGLGLARMQLCGLGSAPHAEASNPLGNANGPRDQEMRK